MVEDVFTAEDRLRYARVLPEVGEPCDAEAQLAAVLEERPEDLGALDLLAKIKHQRGKLTEASPLGPGPRAVAAQSDRPPSPEPSEPGQVKT